jgi:hypothetical protein
MISPGSRSCTPRTAKLGIQILLTLLVGLFAAVAVSQAPAAAVTKTTAAVQAQQPTAPAAGAIAAPKSKPSGVSPQASWTCNWYRNGNNVDSYCTVYSGYIEQWAYCAGWGYIYSGWFGAGSWHLWTYCNGYTLTSWGYLTSG